MLRFDWNRYEKSNTFYRFMNMKVISCIYDRVMLWELLQVLYEGYKYLQKLELLVNIIKVRILPLLQSLWKENYWKNNGIINYSGSKMLGAVLGAASLKLLPINKNFKKIKNKKPVFKRALRDFIK